MNYTHCERFKDYVKYQSDDSTMYEFDNGYGAIVEYNKSVDNLWITIIKDIDGHGFNYAYPDFAHGFCRITGVKVYHLILWLQQINEIKGGHKMTNLDTLKQQTADLEAKLKEMKAEIDRLENGWEMKCPYDVDDEVYVLDLEGFACDDSWRCKGWELNAFNQGNIFISRKAAELEAKRRNLLTRFRAFRDECNGEWKPNWRTNDAKYYFYISSTDNEIGINDIYFYETFPLFGYFKNEEDAQRAIELFGDEIKELFVDGE
jgi:hypothetical protein|nr:MAG TPA: protein of unknown function (DUF5320) [Caudoviricetes sp.]